MIVAGVPTSAGKPSEPAGLEFVGLTVRYFTRSASAIDGLSLSVPRGSFVTVAGRNGAGKSTLALAASGFIPRIVRAHVEGEASIGGRRMADLPDAELRRSAGIVFATPANQLSGSKLTVREELAFGLENLGVPRAAMDPRIDQVLARLHIETLADRQPLALSGGEQQRVAIASIVAMGTNLLVLDEPTAQLDPAGTTSVASLLVELARDGAAVLCAEHSAEVLLASDRCLVLGEGRAIVQDTPGRALVDPAATEAGIPPPTLALLAHAAGLRPDAAFREDLVAAKLATSDGARRAAESLRAVVERRAEDRPAVALGDGRAPATIDVSGLRHVYAGGIEALRGVDLRVGPGESVAIVGQNGSGKTTLVKHLNGLLRPSAGEVRLDSQPTVERPVHELASIVGFVFQNPDDQLFERTVEREVAFGPRNLGFDRDRIQRQVELALAAVGLTEVASTNPYDLDLSSRKLVALAGVLAMDPAVLVLDEPTTGQDAPGIDRISAIVRTWMSTGRSIIAITHDMEFAAANFGRIVVMRQGEVVADGGPDQVFVVENSALLASTGLRAPAAARIGAALGIEAGTPTLRSLVDALAARA
jgi:energy-coupling factor transport system ATP-binding protein